MSIGNSVMIKNAMLRTAVVKCFILCVPFTVIAAEPAKTDSKSASKPDSHWKLVWSDEFDGDKIDRAKWDFDLGNGFVAADGKTFIAGWGNNELEYYTDRAENAFVKDGLLHIKAIKEDYRGSNYTSARLKTRKQDKTALFSKLYGKFEFKAKSSTGRGIWPAIWMMPLADRFGTWPASGEIDILEARGHEPRTIIGTLHYGSSWPAVASSGHDYNLPNKGTIADFHIYALEWEPGEIRLLVDEKLYQTRNFWWSSSKQADGKGQMPASEKDLNAWPAPINQPFYIIMNLAVGGNFVGNPNEKTEFPAEMLVDYVRVYDKVGGYDVTKPRGEGKLPFAK